MTVSQANAQKNLACKHITIHCSMISLRGLEGSGLVSYCYCIERPTRKTQMAQEVVFVVLYLQGQH